jgi:clan AA aspartic protease (TIGR02281 family)
MKRFSAFLFTAIASFCLGWLANERPLQLDQAPALAPLQKPTPTPITRGVEFIRPTTPPRGVEFIRPTPTSPTKPTTPPQNFHQLLASQAYEEAMQLFEQVEATDEAQAESLRATLLAYLRTALEQGRNANLMALVDAYLSRYYDDIDVLLILAEHQRRQGYPEEAASTFQYAFTYAYQPAQLKKVSTLFQSLVKKTDTTFSRQQQWVELLGFYQLLESIDLSQPWYRLRQAKAYLELEDFASARDLLTPLSADTKWSGKAEELLSVVNKQSGDAPEQSTDAGSVALLRRGSHYLVEVGLNGVSDVSLMIDTGASITSLTQSSFETLSQDSVFHYLGSHLFNTANGITQGTIYQADQLSLGDYVLRDVKLAVLDFQQDQRVDGLLGMNVLQHFRFEIDQDQQVIHLQKRK